MATYITIQSGDRVKVNDHVYCSPSWATRDGTPYSVARIMELLPPEMKNGKKTQKGKSKDQFTRVRLAWYYRPSDVSDRATADSRILLAAIYSEVCEITQLRSKCFVAHRDKISDLAGWKKRPDRFYFTRLFDPYIKKEFEVLQSTAVRNIPEEVREVLTSRYEYVVAEKEIIPDLTDSIRLCRTCEHWCPHVDSVQCDRCKGFYHMSCVSPPLNAKPSRGYGWTCAPCARQHEADVGARGAPRNATPVLAAAPKHRSLKSNAPAARGRGRPRKDRTQAEREENLEVKTFKMWPFRYFGLHTVAEDTLDEDDFIFPRTVTRVGPKYQATVPAAPGLGFLDGPSEEFDERGGDETVETLSAVHLMMPNDVAELESAKNSLTSRKDFQTSVDWLTEAIRRLSEAYLGRLNFATVSMKSPVRREKWKKSDTRYTDREWTEEEMAAFEDAILSHGAELRAVREEVRTRTIYEVVRYYGHWKNARVGEENTQKRAGTWIDPMDAKSISSEDEGSIVPQQSKTQPSCGACRTRQSDVWWKAPKGLTTSILCDNCGNNWRKYADLNVRPVREESLVAAQTKAKSIERGEKREGTPLAPSHVKRVKTQTSAPTSSAPVSSRSTPPAPLAVVPPSVPQLQCTACSKKSPVGKVLKCKQCKFQIHAASCGAIVDPSDIDSWECELCHNEKTEEASLNTDCLLCPRRRRDRGKKGLVLPPPDSFLRASKPTEGQGWAHVICAVFMPETSFTDEARLRVVEGISAIPVFRWQKECSICKEQGGATIRCFDCPREYHISCAWRSNYRMGFRMSMTLGRDPEYAKVHFKGERGVMTPVMRCRHHDNERAQRKLWTLCEVDDESGETALQVYCKTYKQAQVDHSHGLLRKARRLDDILDVAHSTSDDSDATLTTDQHCDRCQTEYSPYFHAVSDEESVGWLCHKCHYEEGGIGAGMAIES